MDAFDKDIGWIHTRPMMICLCGHRERSHRPMSRRCTLCDCAKFAQESLPEKKERRLQDRRHG